MGVTDSERVVLSLLRRYRAHAIAMLTIAMTAKPRASVAHPAISMPFDEARLRLLVLKIDFIRYSSAGTPFLRRLLGLSNHGLSFRRLGLRGILVLFY